MNYIEGVSGALILNGKVLIVRRAADDEQLAGYYELPGGKIEAGENREEAAEREIKEELGLRAKATTNYHEFSYQPGPNTHCTDYQYLLELADGEKIHNLKLSSEHDQFKWVDASDLEKMDNITSEMKKSIELALQV